MRIFLETLRFRNEPLFLFGMICLLLACLLFVLSKVTDTEVMGVNAWYKPLKFCLSTTLFSWAMGWYVYYLGESTTVQVFNWVVIIGLGFEIMYIALQASRGQLSHFNVSTPLYASMFSLMAFAAAVVTLFTAYIGLTFFLQDFSTLPDYYVWGIRLGILLFVIFSFQGFMMGANMGYTVGSQDGSIGLPLVNWSITHGDLRIAHFIGMHALQVFPLLAFYLFKNVKLTFFFGALYGLLALFVLIQALQEKPFYKSIL
ncbi:MAG: hypothetical protein AAGI07_01630 [Bacteroidota bacterium]